MHHPNGLSPFDAAALLVVLAAVLGWVNHRYFRLPHTIGLTIMGAVASVVLVLADAQVPGAGLGAALRGFLVEIEFRETLLMGMLSFLLFAGALHVDLDELYSVRWSVLLLATVGVMLSTALVGLGFWLCTLILGHEVPLIWCFVFGALISPTDPVAVMGILKRTGVGRALEAKVAGESLFNDGVGIVVFGILLSIAHGENAGLLSAAGYFIQEAGGGVLLGLGLGWIAFRMIATIDEHNLEVLLTLALVMGGYALAMQIQVSGPLAMAVAGLLIGNIGMRQAMSEHTRQHLNGFWSLIDEILNSVLFLVIGLEVVFTSTGFVHLELALLAVPLALAARAIAVGLPLTFFGRLFPRIAPPFRSGDFHILVWGGLKGGISIALALGLPEGDARAVILTATYAVVLFSIIVQGATVSRLARRLQPPREPPPPRDAPSPHDA